MMNTTGHNNTPAVRLKENSFPKMFRRNGWIPIVSSKEKSFTPINSAINALQINIPARIIKSRVGLLLMIVWIIEIKNIKDQYQQEKDIGRDQPNGYIHTQLSFYDKYTEIAKINERHNDEPDKIADDDNG